MERYEKYKDSGVEWIGEIPEDWEKIKLKYLFRWEKGSNAAIYTNEYVNSNRGNFPVFSGQTENEGILGFINTYDYDFDEDVLLVTTVGAKAMSIKQVRGKFSLSQNCALIIPKGDKADASYFFYFLQRLFAFEKSMISLIMQPSLRFEDLNQYKAYQLPIELQNTIANYLNRKTAEIDELIAQKERLIELYQEEKMAIINQAVTKGINPNAKLKDSGVEWLGEIPEGWDVKKLRYVGNCQNGVSKGADYFGSGFPFVSYGDVYNSIALPKNVEGLANSTEADQISYSVIKGDVFFTRTSETIEEIGIASTCLETINGAIFSGFLIRFRPFKDLLYEGFSKYYFRSTLHRRFFIKEMNLVTRASLSQELLKRLPVILPPFSVQREIASYLDKKTNNIDTKIAKTNRIIVLQEEYRTTLISDVVTGKIKVTEESTP
jgi:type I restriction enzyme S subunit